MMLDPNANAIASGDPLKNIKHTSPRLMYTNKSIFLPFYT